ncbi:hypothetical protein EV121DRAFT_295978 [Schizophyllum commune]
MKRATRSVILRQQRAYPVKVHTIPRRWRTRNGLERDHEGREENHSARERTTGDVKRTALGAGDSMGRGTRSVVRVAGRRARGAIMEDAACSKEACWMRSAPLPPTTVSPRSIATVGLSSACATAPCHAKPRPLLMRLQIDSRRASGARSTRLSPNLATCVPRVCAARPAGRAVGQRLPVHAQIRPQSGVAHDTTRFEVSKVVLGALVVSRLTVALYERQHAHDGRHHGRIERPLPLKQCRLALHGRRLALDDELDGLSPLISGRMHEPLVLLSYARTPRMLDRRRGLCSSSFSVANPVHSRSPPQTSSPYTTKRHSTLLLSPLPLLASFSPLSTLSTYPPSVPASHLTPSLLLLPPLPAFLWTQQPGDARLQCTNLINCQVLSNFVKVRLKCVKVQLSFMNDYSHLIEIWPSIVKVRSNCVKD